MSGGFEESEKLYIGVVFQTGGHRPICTNTMFLQSETQQGIDVLKMVMNGSSFKEKKLDVERGKYARGETAYGHGFDDGLDSGLFKKKIVGSHDFVASVILILHCFFVELNNIIKVHGGMGKTRKEETDQVL